jgi:hypothetical protein
MPDLAAYGLDPYGTVSPETGTFTPSVDPIPTASRMNPYVDSSPWGFVDVGGLRLPGVVLTVDGADKPEEWQVQKGTSSNNASTVWKGTKLAESIKVVLALHDAPSFDAYYQARDLLRPKIGTKPPAHSIANPAINFNGITRVSIKNIGAPKWVSSGGYWTGEVELIEFNPEKPANAGSPKASAAGAKNAPDANADVKAGLDATVAEAGQL